MSIELPSGSRVSGALQVGDLSGTGRLGECTFKTSAGNVRLERTGSLRVNTAAGDVSADGIAGNAEIHTGSGKIRIAEVANGSVEVGTGMGDLEIGITEGAAARLDVTSNFGRVHNLLDDISRPAASDRTADVRAHTSFGGITIRRS